MFLLCQAVALAVQGPDVLFDYAAPSGSARTCFVPGSTAASGSARTRGSWNHDRKWQCKNQLLYLAPQLQVAVQGPVVVFGSMAASGSARTSIMKSLSTK